MRPINLDQIQQTLIMNYKNWGKTPTNFKLDDGSILEKKIILISASPLNNSPEDIKNQILLFQDGKNSTLEISNIDYFFNQKIKQYKALSKEQDKQVIKEQVKDIYGSIKRKNYISNHDQKNQN